LRSWRAEAVADSLIGVYGPGDPSVMAFTDFGIETLAGLVETHKGRPSDLSEHSIRNDGTTHARHTE
jgi:hypothetical protein